jgi:murein DD-endopeptidase MepM/ murein hydrolase activator NlpD
MPRLALAAALVLLSLLPATAAARPDAAGVPRGYPAAERALAQEGRAAVRLLRAGDAAALHARFAPALAAEVPLETLSAALAETLAVAPIAERIGASRLPLAPELRVYSADHRYGSGVLDIDLTFDRRGAITSLRFLPRQPLPPDPAAGRGVRVQLPLEGRWWVFWGGPDERRNYHAVTPAQRHAIDFVRWERGGTSRGQGLHNRDYFAWGERVVAPADGVVVAAKDGVRDNRPRVETNADEPAGNHVLLDLGGGAYALLGHLRAGSVRVRPGDRVRAGQALGRVGNSGNSSEPHLHFHVQDSATPLSGTGLPVRFRDVAVDGGRRRAAAARQARFITARCDRPC